MDELGRLWSKSFGVIPPLGYQLRENFSDRWIRFHALPESKRYAECENEYYILLDRANTLASELFRTGESCLLLSSRPDYPDSMTNGDPEQFARKSRNLYKSFVWEDPDNSGEDRLQWSTYARKMTWKPKSNDDILLKIADDNEFGVLWVSENLSEVFAPYDGGFDLILKDHKRVKSIAKKFPMWLSGRTDGL